MVRRERVNGLTSALLSLVDRGGDPLSDPDHVLVASVILEHWRRGDQLDLTRLLTSLVDPPLSNLGALPMETFYPRDRRLTLVMALNTLIASPSFAAWTTGVPLDMDLLLGSGSTPRATIVTLAHLDERQRQFCLTLLTTELVAWMRRQPSAGGLRALLYIDEVHGILPPHPAAPPTKGPLLTLLKQGRAFGVGVWLATQNPVDLDYKALGNAGVKLIGRLITERDRERALEGLGMAGTDEARGDRGSCHVSRQEAVPGPRRQSANAHPDDLIALGHELPPRPASGTGDRATPATLQAGRRRTRTTTQFPLRPGSRIHQRRRAARTKVSRAPVLTASIPQLYGVSPGNLAPWLFVHNRVTVERRTLALLQSRDELWKVPIAPDGTVLWDDAAELSGEPDLAETPPDGANFPRCSAGSARGRAEGRRPLLCPLAGPESHPDPRQYRLRLRRRPG